MSDRRPGAARVSCLAAALFLVACGSGEEPVAETTPPTVEDSAQTATRPDAGEPEDRDREGSGERAEARPETGDRKPPSGDESPEEGLSPARAERLAALRRKLVEAATGGGEPDREEVMRLRERLDRLRPDDDELSPEERRERAREEQDEGEEAGEADRKKQQAAVQRGGADD